MRTWDSQHCGRLLIFLFFNLQPTRTCNAFINPCQFKPELMVESVVLFIFALKPRFRAIFFKLIASILKVRISLIKRQNSPVHLAIVFILKTIFS